MLVALKNLNLVIPKKKLTIIVGETKSGKSSLLNAIIGEMKCITDAKVNVSGKLSYCPQKPWIINRSVRDNIILANKFDSSKFQLAIRAAAMESDLEEFPGGMEAEIGEKGLNVSGGQKARMGLARAVYDDGDIYLLDDVLSAVDLHVSRKIIENCVLGILKSKTVVLVTHNLAISKYADKVILMHEGRVAEEGTFEEIRNQPLFKSNYELYTKQ